MLYEAPRLLEKNQDKVKKPLPQLANCGTSRIGHLAAVRSTCVWEPKAEITGRIGQVYGKAQLGQIRYMRRPRHTG